MRDKYLKILGLHVLIGVLMFSFRGLSNLYFFSIICFFFIRITNAPQKLKSLEIIKACTYIFGVEVLLRMRGGLIFYEANKYLVIVFIVMGLFYKGFNKKAALYFLYILLLIPSIYVSLNALDIGDNIRKAIAFNLSGPVCLGLSALFCYRVSLTKRELETVINHAIFPLVSTLVYIFIYNPSVSGVATSTVSNFAASGGFGPNQVSTVLGLGAFLVTVRFF